MLVWALIVVAGVELGVIIRLALKLALLKAVIKYETLPNRQGFKETGMNRVVMRAKFLTVFKKEEEC